MRRNKHKGNLQNAEFWNSARQNSDDFIRYYNRLTELSIAMFEWKGLPETVDPRFLELALFGDGMAVFFKDEDIGYLALRCMIGGRWSVYNIPETRTAFATNGYHRKLDSSNSVIIFNNLIHTNSVLDVELSAERLANIERTIDVNINAQKTPILITCEESQRATLMNVYKSYEGNMPAIFGDKNINPNSLKSLTTGAPYVSDRLYEIKTQTWNEILTYLGVSNVNVIKKERLISDEVKRNQGGIVASRYSRLIARKQACEQINKMFGLNVSCSYREDFQELNTDTGEMISETLSEGVTTNE